MRISEQPTRPAPPRMPVCRTQIKTVQMRRDYHEDFDREVNNLLLQGWALVKRFEAPGYDLGPTIYHPMLVAYLERKVELADDVNEDDGK